ncbi:MAG: hypothetical protein LBJ47_07790 [Tannerella sp.]|nr:hypothetical protein [Tannerella sp.]
MSTQYYTCKGTIAVQRPCPSVIASGAKQSRHRRRDLDCFAPLTMTGRGTLPAMAGGLVYYIKYSFNKIMIRHTSHSGLISILSLLRRNGM